MKPDTLIEDLSTVERFFNRSTECLTEEDSGFSPVDGMMTVAQQVAHVAQTIDWFIEGAFRPAGFDMDFESQLAELREVRSLAEARSRLERAFARAREVIGSKTEEELLAPLPEGEVMPGQPRYEVVSGMFDHTTHHRGALAVYARLRGHTPAMPYE
jgi:uncharacterized damage-inducible protein DinB